MINQNYSSKVTVLVPIYNEKILFLRDSLNSLINQTFKNWHCILVFEGGDKNNLKILKDLCKNDKRFRLIEPSLEIGLVKSLNLGLSLAKSKYVARFDSDDIMKPHRLSMQYDFLENNPMISVVGSNIINIDKTGNYLGIRKYPEKGKKLLNYFSFRCGLAHPTVMFRLNHVKKIGMYNEDLLAGEDLDLWLRMLKFGFKLHNLQAPLLEYRSNKFRKSLHWEQVLQIRQANKGLFGKKKEIAFIFCLKIFLFLKKLIDR